MSLANPLIFELQRDAHRLVFRRTRSAGAAVAVVLAAGAAMFGFPLIAAAWDGQLDGSAAALWLIPAPILGLLTWVAVRWRVEHVLDQSDGSYKVGGRRVCGLDEIADVIVLAQDPPDSGPTYTVFFRLANGRRTQLTPTLRPMSRRDEAETFARAVADFLGVDALGDFRECERAGG